MLLEIVKTITYFNNYKILLPENGNIKSPKDSERWKKMEMEKNGKTGRGHLHTEKSSNERTKTFDPSIGS